MYKLYKTSNGNIGIIKQNNDGSVTSFLENPDNTDYQAFLLWKSEGNTPLPAEEQA